MKSFPWKFWAPLGIVAVGGILLLIAWSGSGPRAEATAKKTTASGQPKKLSPAKNLRIVVSDRKAEDKDPLNLDEDVWAEAKGTQIILSRTPRIYQTEPTDKVDVPTLGVKAMRSKGKLILHLRWTDASKNAPQPPPPKTGTGGDPKKLYKRPTSSTATFPDAVAVMVPQKWKGPSFPSLQMGDKHVSANLYYWNASDRTSVITAQGRSTTKPTGKTFKHSAKHQDGAWSVAMELPDVPIGHPVAFAVWQGDAGDRDGLKFFSIWYVLTKE